jgi:hypothetical protein
VGRKGFVRVTAHGILSCVQAQNDECLHSPGTKAMECTSSLSRVKRPSLPDIAGCGYSFLVEIFRGTYRGQKPMRLVMMKMTANIPRMIAAMPVIAPLRYRISTTIARSTLIARSAVPMFFVMTSSFSDYIVSIMNKSTSDSEKSMKKGDKG